MKISFEIDSDNWHAHENDHGFRFIGFQPTATKSHANQDCVCLTFTDEDAGVGVQLVMSHASYRDFMLTVAKSRESIEFKQEEERREPMRKVDIFSGQLNNALAQAVARGTASLENVPGLLKLIIKEERWRSYTAEMTGQRMSSSTFRECTGPVAGSGEQFCRFEHSLRKRPGGYRASGEGVAYGYG
jgi:hypothetical protein